MIFKDIFPTPPLEHLVQRYRLRHFIIPSHIAVPAKPYPPKPENCMQFYLRGYEITEIINENKTVLKPRSVISGQYTHQINRLSSPKEFLMIQVEFKPGALYKLTGVPFNEMHNTHIDLEAIFPKEGGAVNERLCNCIDYSEMIVVIECFLNELQSKIKFVERPFEQVFNLLLNANNKFSLQYLASQACLSARQFERKSYQYLGISPQLFARLVRFNQSYEMRLKHPQFDWLSIAVACGYHDYQHLAKDYKEFTNASPNTLFAAESKVLERVLGLNK
jgi:AraC-like DNA-binding protein